MDSLVGYYACKGATAMARHTNMTRIVQHCVVMCAISISVFGVLLGARSAPVAARSQPINPTATLVGIRAASHPESMPQYDRVVFELQGRLPERIRVEYVPVLLADGSGAVVPVQGTGILHLVLSLASAHTSTGTPTVPARIHPHLSLVKEMVRSGDFEGVVSYGIGLSQKTELRFLTLTNPTRVVIDFLHG
jgi:hypothetical protein